jgi:hypothetical protein
MNTRFLSVLTASASLLLGALATAPVVQGQAFNEGATSPVHYTQARIQPQRHCAELAQFAGGDISYLQPQVVAATAEAPANCRIAGMFTPEVAFEVSLPAHWNGRFYMFGNGGHAGEDLAAPGRVAERNAALKSGFAVAQTNTGHDARNEPGASFGYNNQQKVVDYAFRAVHVTADTAKRLAHAYYDQPVKYSYWNACSTGGRQGLMEAQRFPQDFDGVIAGAPVLDFGGKTISGLWNGKAMDGIPMTVEKLNLVSAAAYARCDKVDGLVDGLIDDPRRCDFDVTKHVAQCRAGKDDGSCLTATQAVGLKKIYDGVVSQGKPYYPGFSVGSETPVVGRDGKPVSQWANFLVSVGSAPPADFGISDQSMKYLVFPKDDPNWNFRTFDYDKDLGQLDAFRALMDATNPDLTPFRRRGGKLLMYFGWADQLLPPMMGVNYYEAALKANGPDTKDFFRFFTVPGMAHCRGGIGPDQFDAVTAIVNWVENGTAPESLKATQLEGGKVKRSRPLCPYPGVARYAGKGDVNDAASFSCVAAPK